jgi:hypothetical protein
MNYVSYIFICTFLTHSDTTLTTFPIPQSEDLTSLSSLKLCCNEHFTHALTARGCVFKEITLVATKQGNYFENENATACSKRMLKTIVATQLDGHRQFKLLGLISVTSHLR